MTIVVSSESEDLRAPVKEALINIEHRLERKLRILDVGGGLIPWLGDLVTDVMDIDARQGVAKFEGDVCLASTWEDIQDKYFDFVNCTHTLEDIRDPGFVIAQMSRVGKAGFVAVPNRHTENLPIQYIYQLGYAHHRWMFHLSDAARLEAVAKFPILSVRQFGLDLIGRAVPRRLINSRIGRYIPNSPKKVWIAKRHKSSELGLMWIDQLDFSYINGDYAGRSPQALMDMAHEFLSRTFVSVGRKSDIENELFVRLS